MAKYKRRKQFTLSIIVFGFFVYFIFNPLSANQINSYQQDWQEFIGYDLNLGDFKIDDKIFELLDKIPVKGRAPKTNYKRDKFSQGWAKVDKCDLRNLILKRDLNNVKLAKDKCTVLSGELEDLYSKQKINFVRGPKTSSEVQIDHVVAVSDAWQKGAQQLSSEQRKQFYNDPLNLIAVSKEPNQAKSDSDAASWLPPNKSFRCQYVARQVKVKAKYKLWVTEAEKIAISQQLAKCPQT